MRHADDGARPNVFSFATDSLVTAGEWAAVMEYAEQRPELSRALTKREAVLRSTAATFQARNCFKASLQPIVHATSFNVQCFRKLIQSHLECIKRR